MMRRVKLALLGLLVACASPPPQPVVKQPWPGFEERAGAPAAPEGEAVGAPDDAAKGAVPAAQRDTVEEIARLVDRDPKAWVARYPKSDQCEVAARALRRTNRDRAWRGLRACVDRGAFKLLGRLTDGFWDEELRSRPDASVVLASVIAARGADIVGDVETLQRRRIPLFTMEIAKANPAMYKGRSVIFAASVDNVSPTKGGKALARLALVQLVNRGRRVVHSRREYGARLSDGNETKSYSDYDEFSTVRYDNQAEETEEVVLARLSSVDPFFAPGRRFVVVGRFEGFTTPAATPEEPEPEQVPVTSVYAYFEPGALTAE